MKGGYDSIVMTVFFRARFGGLDSLMKMLLSVDVLQPLVIDALLEWMPDYMSDGAGPVG